MGNPWHWQSYGASLAIWDHSVTCYPTQVNVPRHNPSQPGRYSIYLPRRDGRLSSLDRGSNLRPLDRKSDALTITPPYRSATECTKACWFRSKCGLFVHFCVFYLGPCSLFVLLLLALFFFVCRYFLLFVLSLVVSTSPTDCVERLVSEMTCYVSSGKQSST